MPKAIAQIALTAAFGVALIPCLGILLFGNPSNATALVTVIGFLIGSVFCSAFLPHLRDLKIGPVSATVRDLSRQVEDQSLKQSKQGEDIKLLQFLIVNFIGKFELTHLEGLEKAEQGKAYPFDCVRKTFEEELVHLRSLGLIDNFTGKGIVAMKREGKGNLNEHFHITDSGREYLKLRRQVMDRLGSHPPDAVSESS